MTPELIINDGLRLFKDVLCYCLIFKLIVSYLNKLKMHIHLLQKN